MKKFSFLVGLYIFFLSTIYHASAHSFPVPEQLTQGNTAKFDIQKNDILTTETSFLDHSFKSYTVQKPFSMDMQVSKRVFLKGLLHTISVPSYEQFLYTMYDVPKKDPDYTLFAYAVNKGILAPSPASLLYPDSPITIAEASQLAVRIHKYIPTTFTSPPLPSSDTTYMSYAHAEKLLSTLYNKQYTLPHPTTVLFLRTYIAPHRTKDSGITPITLTYMLKNGTKKSITKNLHIQKASFRVSRFSLAADRFALFQDDAQEQTWSKVDAARSTSSPTQLWSGKFLIPVQGKQTSHFGDIMYINGIYSGSHFGIDYAAPTGTPIVASNTGKVVLSEYTPAFGETIMIDHGHDIFTMYLHLSERSVNKGENVTKGQIIGKNGNTGISTGPHLHFTFFVKDIIVNNKEWTDGLFP